MDLNIATLEGNVVRKKGHECGLNGYGKSDDSRYFAYDRPREGSRLDKRRTWSLVWRDNFLEARLATITPITGLSQGADDALRILQAIRSIEDQHKVLVVFGVEGNTLSTEWDRRK
jgi:hypothetical protein